MKPCHLTPFLTDNHTHFVDVRPVLNTTMMKVSCTLYTLIVAYQFYALHQKQILQEFRITLQVNTAHFVFRISVALSLVCKLLVGVGCIAL